MTGLTVRGAAAVRAPEGRDGADDPAVLDYFQDLLGPFGVEPDKELLRRGAHVYHEDLADALLEANEVAGSRPDLLVVTHALPDVVPFTAVAPYLTARLGGRATCFSLAQQGLAAPFTALRVAAAYRRAGRVSEVLLAVLEQTTLPTEFPLAGDVPLTDSAAALVLGAGPAAGAGSEPAAGAGPGPAAGAGHEPAVGAGLELVRVAADVTPGTVLAAGPDGTPYDDRTLLVLGSWLTGEPPAGPDVHRAAPGSYCTGVWLELAEHWADWQRRYARVVLCDTDPRTGTSHLAEFGTGRPHEPAARPGR